MKTNYEKKTHTQLELREISINKIKSTHRPATNCILKKVVDLKVYLKTIGLHNYFGYVLVRLIKMIERNYPYG